MSLTIQPLGALNRIEEGEILRGLLGMLVKRRTADADMLEFGQEAVRKFLVRHSVGVTKDDVAGNYVVVVQRRPTEQTLEVVT